MNKKKKLTYTSDKQTTLPVRNDDENSTTYNHNSSTVSIYM